LRTSNWIGAGQGFERHARSLTETKVEQWRQRRLERCLRASKLPQEKTQATLNAGRMPVDVLLASVSGL